MKKTELKSICILRLSALGDCINAFGLIHALKQQNKDLDLAWVIDKRFASLFKREDGSDLVKLYPVDIKKRGLIGSVLDLRANLKKVKFDALLNLQTSIKASLLSTSIRSPLKYGYDKERRREGQRFFINRQVISPNSAHVLDGFMAFAKAIGFDNLKPSWDFEFSANELEQAKNLVEHKHRIFTIAPASAKAYKNWTADGYIKIAKYAIKQGFNLVLVGSNSPLELKLCEDIEKGVQGNCINLCGKTSLRSLGCVINLSSLVLSPDSAAMHLANAQNVPVISLMAIHSPDRVGAYNFRHLEISVYQEMALAELKGKKASWRYRVKNENAMKKISFNMVKNIFDKAIKDYKL